MRGIVGAFERSWSGDPGTIGWTKILAPLALLYGAGSAMARRRASARRRPLPEAHVIAVGNLVVGGTGKSSLARWLAREATASGARCAILLRGHGSRERAGGPRAVPDFEGYAMAERVGRYGDEAIAHRMALGKAVAVLVDADRFQAARAALEGYGARSLVLDDAWEQGSLAWDELWVAVDPRSPEGNGLLLPSGPLRRPASTLAEATRVVCVLEEPGEDVPPKTRIWLARFAPERPLLRFRRILRGVSPVGAPEVLQPPEPGLPVALLSGIGSPARLERFARGVGFDWRWHGAFPDHARWSVGAIEGALRMAASTGARVALITEKDEPRWPHGMTTPLPVSVLRTDIEPLDDTAEALGPLRAAVANRSRIG